MDDDDMIYPEKTELQVKFLQKYPHLDGVYSRYHFIDINNNVLDRSRQYGGVESKLLRMITVNYNTLQYITALFRLNDKTRKEIQFVFEYADDALLSRHLLVSANLDMYMMTDKFLAAYRLYPSAFTNKISGQDKARSMELASRASKEIRYRMNKDDAETYFQSYAYEVDEVVLANEEFGFLFNRTSKEYLQSPPMDIDFETVQREEAIDFQREHTPRLHKLPIMSKITSINNYTCIVRSPYKNCLD